MAQFVPNKSREIIPRGGGIPSSGGGIPKTSGSSLPQGNQLRGLPKSVKREMEDMNEKGDIKISGAIGKGGKGSGGGGKSPPAPISGGGGKPPPPISGGGGGGKPPPIDIKKGGASPSPPPKGGGSQGSGGASPKGSGGRRGKKLGQGTMEEEKKEDKDKKPADGGGQETPTKCPCGGHYTARKDKGNSAKNKHEKTDKHQNWVKKNKKLPDVNKGSGNPSNIGLSGSPMPK